MSDTKLPAESEPKPHQSLVTVEDRYIHSDIFDKLVRGEHDIPGLVAYGLYQIRKREWIAKHQREFSCLPVLDDVKKFSFGWGDGALEALRQEAEADMFRFTESIIDSQSEELMSNAYNAKTVAEIEDLKKLIRRKTGYRHHIAGHVVGFAVLVVITALVLFGIKHEPSLASVVDMINPAKQ